MKRDSKSSGVGRERERYDDEECSVVTYPEAENPGGGA